MENQHDISVSAKLGLLGEIGIEILSLLSAEQINELVYEKIHHLMDADVFGIAEYDSQRNELHFNAIIERGEKVPASISLLESHRPGVWCFNNRDLLLINNWERDYPKYFGKLPSEKTITGGHTHSLLYYPLVAKENVLGVITVQSFKEEAYSDQDINIIRNLSVYIATALNNARIYHHAEEIIEERTQELKNRQDELVKAYERTRLLSEIGHKISSSLSVEEIINHSYTSVQELMGAHIFGIAVLNNNDENKLDFYVKEYGENFGPFHVNLLDQTLPASVCYKTEKPVFLNDFLQDIKKINPDFSKPLVGKVVGALIYLPLVAKGKKIGVVTVQHYEKNVFTDQHLTIFETLAVYVASALENAMLYTRMEQEVELRTEEVVKQKEDLEQSFKNISILSRIGQKITSTLSLEKILDTLYGHVNQLMDATEFGVSTYNDERKTLRADYYIYKGKRMTDDDMELDINNPYRLSAWSLRNRREVFINDMQEEYHEYIPDLSAYRDDETGAFVMGSLMYIPLVFEDRLLGGISVQSPNTNAYTSLHLDMFRTLASYAAVALNNAEAYQHLNRSNSRLIDSYRNIEILGRIGQKITSTLDIDHILEVVYNNINQLMDATEFGVGIYDRNREVINLGYYIFEGKRANTAGATGTVNMDDNRRLSVWCVKNNKEVFINDIETEYQKYVPNLDAYKTEGVLLMNSLMCLPLSSEGKVIGIISVQSPNRNAYTEVHLEMFRTIAAYTSVAVNNAEAYQLLRDAMHEVEKLSVVASKTNNSVLIFGPDLELMWANEAFVTNTGYLFEEFKEKQGKSIYQISAKEEIRELVDHCIARGRSVSYDSMNISRNGQKMWFHTTLTPVFDEEGLLKNIVAIDADITKIKRAEEELLQKNKDITDSINYALRIQNSILPSRERIKELIPDSFVLYRPRDIVSGDFYWVEEIENKSKVMVVAVDCTGHGVPGAFLTIVGNSLLNQIVNEQNIFDPRQVVIEMNKGILKRLSVTKGDNVRDGMDMAICVIDKETEEVELVCSGAYNPLYIFNGSELMETNPIRISVGGMDETTQKQVSKETWRLKKGDTVYLATDGYADQLGGKNGKKYMRGRFKKLLEQLNREGTGMYEQKSALRRELENWKGSLQQTDDILIIGFRIV